MSMPRPKRSTSRRSELGRDREPTSAQTKLPKWGDAMAEAEGATFRAYDGAARFPVGSFVEHAKFGKGLVVDSEPGKVTLLFEDGLKKLVQAS